MKITYKKCGYQSDDEVDFMRCINENMTDILCNDCCEKIECIATLEQLKEIEGEKLTK